MSTITDSGSLTVVLSSGDAIVVKEGTAANEVWRFKESGEMSITNVITCADTLEVVNRKTGGSPPLMDVRDSTGTLMSQVDQDGRWINSSGEGVVLGVVSSEPSDTPPDGTLRLYSSGGVYRMYVYDAATWWYLTLT